MNVDEQSVQVVADAGMAGKRLDQVLPEVLRQQGIEMSRSAVQDCIKKGLATLNGKQVKPRIAVSAGDEIHFTAPAASDTLEVQPEDIPLEVLYEDEHIIVINKAPGMVVHPGAGNDSGTLVNALLHHCDGRLSELADEGRPGIVHRLDKETSGCLVAAKSDLAYESLVAQFSGRQTEKHYIAITAGIPMTAEGRLENHIGRHPVHRQRMAVVEPPAGKSAITDYRVSAQSETGDPWAWVDCQIHTGRTHQIRVHMRECLRCPILGDSIYAQLKRQKPKVDRLMLHAARLSIRHPESSETCTFAAPLPEAFERFKAEGH